MNYAELINKIPEEEKPEILRLLRALDEAKAREAAEEHFLDFVKLMIAYVYVTNDRLQDSIII